MCLLTRYLLLVSVWLCLATVLILRETLHWGRLSEISFVLNSFSFFSVVNSKCSVCVLKISLAFLPLLVQSPVLLSLFSS